MVGRFSFKSSSRLTSDQPGADETVVNGQEEALRTNRKRTVGVARLSDLINARVQLHQVLIDKINISRLETMGQEELKEELMPIVRQFLRDSSLPLNASEIDGLIDGVVNEMLGLGPIEPLLDDDTISDILIVGPDTVYIERFGKLEMTTVRFRDEDHLLRITRRIVSAVGRRVDEATPMVDARLPDGSRVNVAIRPAAVDGPQVSIRKFSRNPMKLYTLVSKGALTEPMADLLSAAVEARVSMIISGGTGSGKTTLLNALSNFIPHTERLITIEDAAELQLQQPHVVRLETRPPSLEGQNEIAQRDLVKNALRMRPDRIIVGEVRGEEAFDMLQAMNTGHEGSMTTIHANTPRDAMMRVEQMVGMADMPMSERSVREQIASAISIIIQTSRLRDGSRKVTSITEVTGMEENRIQLQEIAGFDQAGVDKSGRVIGHFSSRGIRPKFFDQLEAMGVSFDSSAFEIKN